MGKFNFVAGGYYGKVGETVGQRWHNQRLVRSYVIPKNPQTEIQQQNRADFADCTGATQLAIQLNGNSLLWETKDNTAFNNRMGESRRYAEAGGDFYTYIPVLPYGYEPAFSFIALPALSNGVLTWTCTADADLSGRTMAVALQLHDTDNNKDVRSIVHLSVTGTAGAWKMSYTIPSNLSLSAKSWQIGINDDDAKNLLPEIYLPGYSLASLKTPVEIALESVGILYDEETSKYEGHLSANVTLASDARPLLSATVSGVLQGVSVEQNIVIQSVSSVGGLEFEFTPVKDDLGQRILFPTNSKITLSASSFESDEYIYTFQNTELAFDAELEQQQFHALELSAVLDSEKRWVIDTGISGVERYQYGLASYGVTKNPDLSDEQYDVYAEVTAISPTLVLKSDADQTLPVCATSQLLTVEDMPNIVLHGVTYTLRQNTQITLPSGTTTFSISVSGASVAFDSTENKQIVTLSLSDTVHASVLPSGSFVYHGAMQAAFANFTVQDTAVSAGASLVFNPPFTQDVFGQIPHFPSGSYVVVPTMQTEYNGYTYSFVGVQLDLLENSIPTLSYQPAISIFDDDGYPGVQISLPDSATNIVPGRICSPLLARGASDNFGVVLDTMETYAVSGTDINYTTDYTLDNVLLAPSGLLIVKATTHGTFSCIGVTWGIMGDSAQTVTFGAPLENAPEFEFNSYSTSGQVVTLSGEVSFPSGCTGTFTFTATSPQSFSISVVAGGTNYDLQAPSQVSLASSASFSNASSVFNLPVTVSAVPVADLQDVEFMHTDLALGTVSFVGSLFGISVSKTFTWHGFSLEP